MSYVTFLEELSRQGSTSRVLSGQILLLRSHAWNNLKFVGKGFRLWETELSGLFCFNSKPHVCKKPGIDYHLINIHTVRAGCWSSDQPGSLSTTFLQDNEPKHTAKTGRGWRRARSLITIAGKCIQIWVSKAHSVTPRGLKGASAVKGASKLPARLRALTSR